jgi:hypothetical protein
MVEEIMMKGGKVREEKKGKKKGWLGRKEVV